MSNKNSIDKNTCYRLNKIDTQTRIVIYSDSSGYVMNKDGKIIFYFTNISELNKSLNEGTKEYESHYIRDKKHSLIL